MTLYANKFRPMGIGDIFDEVFDLYKHNFVVLAGIGTALFMPVYLALAALSYSTYAQFGVQFILLAVVNPFVTTALCFAISQTFLGRQTTIGKSYRFVGRRFWQYLGTWTLSILVPVGAMMAPGAVGAAIGGVAYLVFHEWWPAAVLGGLGLMAGIVLAVLMGIWFTFVPAVFAVEGLKYIAALKRSRELVAGHVGRIFAVLFLVNLLVGIVTFAALMPLGMLSGFETATTGESSPITPIQNIITGIVTSLLQPVSLCAIVLLYYDARIRKEGFDLQLLAEELSAVSAEKSDLYPAGPTPDETTGWSSVLGEPPPAPDIDDRIDRPGGAEG